MPEQFGPYRLDGELGRGGMGTVYRAFDPRHDRYVALKVLADDLATNAGFRARFARECQVVARLSDPHVVPIHAFGEIDGRLYLDMRLVHGRDLGVVLDTDGPLAPRRAVAVLEQVAAALDSAHADGVVHRDVKPSNVLLVAPRGPGGPDFAYLVDFGITRTIGDTDPRLTGTGVAVGTPAYMAPEQFRGAPPDGRVDVYALACVLHECLTGEPPFPAREPVALMYAHLDLAPPPVSTRRRGLPPALDAVLATGLAKDPARRPPTAGALLAAARAALDAAGSDRPTVPGPARPPVAAPTERPPDGPRPAPPGATPAVTEGARPGRPRSRRAVAVGTAIAAGVVLALVVAFVAAARSGTAAGGGVVGPATVSCAYPAADGAARPVTPPPTAAVPATGSVVVQLLTSLGPVILQLDRARAPCTVNSFTSLARQRYFDATFCHRLTTVEGLRVLQCGDPTGTGSGGPGYTIPDEPPTTLAPAASGGGVVYPRGTVAMAKTAQPNSGGSQFFLVHGDSVLPPDYTVFGTVGDAGLAVLDRVAADGADDGNGPGDGRPRFPIDIRQVTIAV